MYGEKVSGGYEAGFLHTEQQVALVREALAKTTWEKAYIVRPRYDAPYRATERQGLVRAKVRPGIGFGGVKGFVVVSQTKNDELEAVSRAVNGVVYTAFKPGDRVRTVVLIHAWSGKPDWPIGRTGTVQDIYSGHVRVIFDDEPGNVLECPWYWFEVIAK